MDVSLPLRGASAGQSRVNTINDRKKLLHFVERDINGVFGPFNDA